MKRMWNSVTGLGKDKGMRQREHRGREDAI